MKKVAKSNVSRQTKTFLVSRPRQKYRRYTVYLEMSAKAETYRNWSQLTALDFAVEEINEKAGFISGEWDGEDVKILEAIPGVAMVREKKNVEPLELRPAV